MADLIIKKRYANQTEYLKDVAKQTGVYDETLGSNYEYGYSYSKWLANKKLNGIDVSKIKDIDTSYLNASDKLMKLQYNFGDLSDDDIISFFDNSENFKKAYGNVDGYFKAKQEEGYAKVLFDNMAWYERIFRSIDYAAGQIVAGITSTMEGLIDAGATLASLFTSKETSKRIEDFIKQDYTGVGELSQTLEKFRHDKIDWDSNITITKILGDVVNNMTRMTALLIPYAGQSIYFGAMGGNTVEQTLQNNPNATIYSATANALIQTAVELVTEKMFMNSFYDTWSIFKLGGAQTNMVKRFGKAIGEEALEEVVAELIENPLQTAFEGRASEINIGEIFKDAAYSGLIGGLTGGLSEGGAAIRIKNADFSGIISKSANLKVGEKLALNEVLGELNEKSVKKADNVENFLRENDISTEERNKLYDNKHENSEIQSKYNEAKQADDDILTRNAQNLIDLARLVDIIGKDKFESALKLATKTSINLKATQEAVRTFITSINDNKIKQQDLRVASEYAVSPTSEYGTFIPIYNISSSASNLSTAVEKITGHKIIYGSFTHKDSTDLMIDNGAMLDIAPDGTILMNYNMYQQMSNEEVMIAIFNAQTAKNFVSENPKAANKIRALVVKATGLTRISSNLAFQMLFQNPRIGQLMFGSNKSELNIVFKWLNSSKVKGRFAKEIMNMKATLASNIANTIADESLRAGVMAEIDPAVLTKNFKKRGSNVFGAPVPPANRTQRLQIITNSTKPAIVGKFNKLYATHNVTEIIAKSEIATQDLSRLLLPEKRTEVLDADVFGDLNNYDPAALDELKQRYNTPFPYEAINSYLYDTYGIIYIPRLWTFAKAVDIKGKINREAFNSNKTTFKASEIFTEEFFATDEITGNLRNYTIKIIDDEASFDLNTKVIRITRSDLIGDLTHEINHAYGNLAGTSPGSPYSQIKERVETDFKSENYKKYAPLIKYVKQTQPNEFKQAVATRQGTQFMIEQITNLLYGCEIGEQLAENSNKNFISKVSKTTGFVYDGKTGVIRGSGIFLGFFLKISQGQTYRKQYKAEDVKNYLKDTVTYNDWRAQQPEDFKKLSKEDQKAAYKNQVTNQFTIKQLNEYLKDINYSDMSDSLLELLRSKLKGKKDELILEFKDGDKTVYEIMPHKESSTAVAAPKSDTTLNYYDAKMKALNEQKANEKSTALQEAKKQKILELQKERNAEIDAEKNSFVEKIKSKESVNFQEKNKVAAQIKNNLVKAGYKLDGKSLVEKGLSENLLAVIFDDESSLTKEKLTKILTNSDIKTPADIAFLAIALYENEAINDLVADDSEASTDDILNIEAENLNTLYSLSVYLNTLSAKEKEKFLQNLSKDMKRSQLLTEDTVLSASEMEELTEILEDKYPQVLGKEMELSSSKSYSRTQLILRTKLSLKDVSTNATKAKNDSRLGSAITLTTTDSDGNTKDADIKDESLTGSITETVAYGQPDQYYDKFLKPNDKANKVETIFANNENKKIFAMKVKNDRERFLEDRVYWNWVRDKADKDPNFATQFENNKDIKVPEDFDVSKMSKESREWAEKFLTNKVKEPVTRENIYAALYLLETFEVDYFNQALETALYENSETVSEEDIEKFVKSYKKAGRSIDEYITKVTTSEKSASYYKTRKKMFNPDSKQNKNVPKELLAKYDKVNDLFYKKGVEHSDYVGLSESIVEERKFYNNKANKGKDSGILNEFLTKLAKDGRHNFLLSKKTSTTKVITEGSATKTTTLSETKAVIDETEFKKTAKKEFKSDTKEERTKNMLSDSSDIIDYLPDDVKESIEKLNNNEKLSDDEISRIFHAVTDAKIKRGVGTQTKDELKNTFKQAIAVLPGDKGSFVIVKERKNTEVQGVKNSTEVSELWEFNYDKAYSLIGASTSDDTVNEAFGEILTEIENQTYLPYKGRPNAKFETDALVRGLISILFQSEISVENSNRYIKYASSFGANLRLTRNDVENVRRNYDFLVQIMEAVQGDSALLNKINKKLGTFKREDSDEGRNVIKSSKTNLSKEVKEQSNKITEKTTERTNLSKDLNNLQIKIDQLTKKITDLESIQKDTNTSENDKTNAKKEIEKLNKELSDLKTKEESYENKIYSLNADIKNMEADLLETKEKLKLYEELEKAFIKNDINGILGCFQTLMSKYGRTLDDETRNYIERVIRPVMAKATLNAEKTIKEHNDDDSKARKILEAFRTFRYNVMLSSPSTWLRNIMTNKMVKIFENLADWMSTSDTQKKLANKGVGWEQIEEGTFKLNDRDRGLHFIDMQKGEADQQSISFVRTVLLTPDKLDQRLDPEKQRASKYGLDEKNERVHLGKKQMTLKQRIKAEEGACNKVYAFIEEMLSIPDIGNIAAYAQKLLPRLLSSDFEYIREQAINLLSKKDPKRETFRNNNDATREEIFNFIHKASPEFFEPYVQIAFTEAKRTFFRNDNALSYWFNKISRDHPVMGIFLSTIMVFPKMSYNLMQTILDYSPAGFVKFLLSKSATKKLISEALKSKEIVEQAVATINNLQAKVDDLVKTLQDMDLFEKEKIEHMSKLSLDDLINESSTAVSKLGDKATQKQKDFIRDLEELNNRIKIAQKDKTADSKNINKILNDYSQNGGQLDMYAKTRLVKQLVKAEIGTVIFAIGSLLALVGWLDIDDEDYFGVSLNIGNLKIRLSDIEPISSPLIYGASFVKLFSSGSVGLQNIVNQMIQNSSFDFAIDAIEYSDNITEWLTQVGGNLVLQYIPNIYKQFSKVIFHNKKVKSSNSFDRVWQNVIDYIPWARDALLQDKVDPYTGRAVKRYDLPDTVIAAAELLAVVLPIKWTYRTESEAEKVTKNIDATAGQGTGRIMVNNKQYKLTGEELREFRVYRATYINNKLDKLISTNIFKNASKEKKKTLIKTLYSRASEYAKKQWLKNNKSIAKKYIAQD